MCSTNIKKAKEKIYKKLSIEFYFTYFQKLYLKQLLCLL